MQPYKDTCVNYYITMYALHNENNFIEISLGFLVEQLIG